LVYLLKLSYIYVTPLYLVNQFKSYMQITKSSFHEWLLLLLPIITQLNRFSYTC